MTASFGPGTVGATGNGETAYVVPWAFIRSAGVTKLRKDFPAHPAESGNATIKIRRKNANEFEAWLPSSLRPDTDPSVTASLLAVVLDGNRPASTSRRSASSSSRRSSYGSSATDYTPILPIIDSSSYGSGCDGGGGFSCGGGAC